MISIAFGRLLSDPFTTSGNDSMYVLNNLAFVILLLWLENGKDRCCLDKLLPKLKRSSPDNLAKLEF
jgi:hypothetical protein